MSSNPPAPTRPSDIRHSDFVIDSDFGLRASGFTLPVPLTAAALVAFLTLNLTAGKSPALPLLAVLLIATHVTPARLPDRALFRWLLRALALAALLATQGRITTNTVISFFEPEYTCLAGAFFAAEFVIRAWTGVAPARLARSRRILLLITALVMAAASNTFERFPFQLLAAVYTLLVALALRTLALDAAAPPAPVRTTGRPPPRLPLWLLRGVAFALTLLLGASTVLAVTKYDNRITTWAFNLLRPNKLPTRSAIGFSASPPRLGPVFNPDATLDRALLIDGPRADRHLRILAFDTYDRTFWRPDVGSRAFGFVRRHLAATQPATAPTQTLRITRLADLADLLPVPADATAVLAPGDIDRDTLAALRDHAGGGNPAFAVTVPSAPSTAELVHLAPPPDAAQRQRLLAVPAEIDPRVLSLAHELTASDPTPARRVTRLAHHLRSTHAYSLSFTPDPDTDPLNDFILNDRAAHCQYFASALVILSRAAGVPARLVTGYYAHEPYGADQTVVRERDAHAWAECYLDGVGWVTADATPPAGRPDGLFPDPPRWRTVFERLRDLPGHVREWITSLPRTRVYAAVALLATVILAVALTRSIKLHHRRRPTTPHDAYPPPAAEIRDAATRFERWLRSQGRPLPTHLTWREHARSLTTTHPHVLAFLDTYDAARFGPPTPHLLPRLTATLAQLEAAPRT